jgi:hypothetical protein
VLPFFVPIGDPIMRCKMPKPSTETQPPSITETQYRTISETWEIIPGTLIGTQESDGLTKVTTA